ncbi:hypothetical protein [Synechococcus sp. PCC 7336]|nr:hypothetical protein [Synechococcus sp. PCC 7336]
MTAIIDTRFLYALTDRSDRNQLPRSSNLPSDRPSPWHQLKPLPAPQV